MKKGKWKETFYKYVLKCPPWFKDSGAIFKLIEIDDSLKELSLSIKKLRIEVDKLGKTITN